MKAPNVRVRQLAPAVERKNRRCVEQISGQACRDEIDGVIMLQSPRKGAGRQPLTIELAANVLVITLVKKSAADIKAGDTSPRPGPRALTARY